METRAVAHYVWMRTAVQTWLMTITLTLALWASAHAATPQYDFRPFNLPFPDLTSFSLNAVEPLSNHLVGSYTDIYSEGLPHGWRGNGTFTSVPLQAITAVNKAKWVAGYYYVPGTQQSAGFLYTNTAFIPITIPGCFNVNVQGMNNTNELVGDCSAEADGVNHPFHWKDGQATIRDPVLLDDHGQPVPIYEGCGATGINNAGVIVGACDFTGYLDAHGTFTSIALPNASVYPKGLMDSGTVYGVACPYDGGACPGFLLRNGQWTFLTYPGALVTTIETVHPTSGKLWGNYLDADGTYHGFIGTKK